MTQNSVVLNLILNLLNFLEILLYYEHELENRTIYL